MPSITVPPVFRRVKVIYRGLPGPAAAGMYPRTPDIPAAGATTAKLTGLVVIVVSMPCFHWA
jgi:hypothetical protein